MATIAVMAALALVATVALRRWWRRRPTTTPAYEHGHRYDAPTGRAFELGLVVARGRIVTGLRATMANPGPVRLALVRDAWGGRTEVASCEGVGQLAITGLAELVQPGATYSAVITSRTPPVVRGVSLDSKGT